MLVRERGYTQSFRDFQRAMRFSGEKVLIGDPEYGASRRHLLFVYGTMKLGFRNHERIKYGAKFVMNTMTETYMAPVAMSMDSHDDGYRIAGEVYEVDGALLSVIDQHEGHPHVYERERVHVDGIEGAVWMYLYQGSSMKISEKGIQVDEESRTKTFIHRG
jgi:gamma-glutamylcyclotransferase (GGCT)/AIG2-like uncharacterized protein YtfP